MKTLGRSLAIVLIWTAVALCQTATWQSYEYPDDGFAVTAPKKPTMEKEPDPNTSGEELHYYSVDLGGDSGVMIAIAKIRENTEAVPVRDILQATKNGGLTKTNSKLVSEKDILLDGNLGLEFETEGQPYHMRARIYFVDGILIQLMSVAPSSKPFSPMTDRIFNSFRLLKKT